MSAKFHVSIHSSAVAKDGTDVMFRNNGQGREY